MTREITMARTPHPQNRARTTRTRRLVVGLVLTAALSGVALPVDGAGAIPPTGYSSEQEHLRSLVNDTRVAEGLRPLAFHQVFANKAQTWAEVLADCECLWHRRPPFGAGRGGFYAAAENLGNGASLSLAYAGQLAMATERATILNRRFTHIGTGVARAADGEVYIVIAFMDRTP